MTDSTGHILDNSETTLVLGTSSEFYPSLHARVRKVVIAGTYDPSQVAAAIIQLPYLLTVEILLTEPIT